MEPSLPTHPFTASSLLPRPCSYLKTSLLALAKERGLRIEFLDISGGPAAGKTEIMLRIEFEMSQRGWLVLTIPEAATIIRNMNLRAEEGIIPNIIAQQMMMDLNQHLRMQALAAAIDMKGVTKILIVGDRSDLDCIPYVGSRDKFNDLLLARGINVGDITHGVHNLFMHSLAVDDPDLYRKVCAGNRARKESAEQAARMNGFTLDAIRLFANPAEIGNKYADGFEGKMKAAVVEICRMLDEAHIQHQAAFMVNAGYTEVLHFFGLLSVQPITIEQFYTAGGIRYRMTEYPGGHRVFAVTNKMDEGRPGYRYAVTERVHHDVYHEAFENRDTNLKVIKKRRYAGLFDKGIEPGTGGLFVTVDNFEPGLIPSRTQRVEVSSVNTLVVPWADTDFRSIDVTGKPEYSNLGISRGQVPTDLFA